MNCWIDLVATRKNRSLSKSSVAQPICRTQLIRNMNMKGHKKTENLCK